MSTKKIVFGGIVGALYAALTLSTIPMSFGAVQCRLSEALCILPLINPSAVWGLFVGCLISNIYMGNIVDIIFGSLTTLLAAFLTYKTRRRPFLAMLFPVILNAVIVGGYIYFIYPSDLSFFMSMLSVGAGQAISCYAVGMPLYFLIRKTKPLQF